MSYDWLPFAGGIVLFALQPALDLAWSRVTLEYFRNQGEYPYVGTAGFNSVLAWTVDLAQLVPSAFLLLLGATLVGDSAPRPLTAGVLLTLFLVVLAALLVVGGDKEPHTYVMRFWPTEKFCSQHRSFWNRCRRSKLQWLLLALNLAGLAAAFAR